MARSGSAALRPPSGGALLGPSRQPPLGARRPARALCGLRAAQGVTRCARPCRPLRAGASAPRPVGAAASALRPPGFGCPAAPGTAPSLVARSLPRAVAAGPRPSPGSGRPPAPRLLRPLRRAGGGSGPWVAGLGLGLLRAPCGRPARRCGLPRPLPCPRGAPLASAPSGPAGLRGSGPAGPPGLLPPGGAVGRPAAALLVRPAPPGVGVGVTRAGRSAPPGTAPCGPGTGPPAPC